MKKHTVLCNGKIVITTDEETIVDIRELKMGKKSLIVMTVEVEK